MSAYTTIDLDVRAMERIETVEEFLAQLDATAAAAVTEALALASAPTSPEDLASAELDMASSVNLAISSPQCWTTMRQRTKYCR